MTLLKTITYSSKLLPIALLNRGTGSGQGRAKHPRLVSLVRLSRGNSRASVLGGVSTGDGVLSFLLFTGINQGLALLALCGSLS